MAHRAFAAVLRGLVLVAIAALVGCARTIASGKLYDITREATAAPVAIVPGVSVGPVRFDMTKDEVVRTLGVPDTIFYGDARFSLKDSPTAAYYVFGKAGLSICFQLGELRSITVLSELYEYPGGLRVGMHASRAEVVFGKLPDVSSFRADSTVVRWYKVIFSGTATYRVTDYGSVILKVDEATGLIKELLLVPPFRDEGLLRFLPLPDEGELFAEKEGKERRLVHARMLRDTGVPLDGYAVSPVRWTLREDPPRDGPEYPIVDYWYVMKLSAAYQEAAKAADVFISQVDSMSLVAPSVSELVARFGLPSAFVVNPVAGENDKIHSIYYGDLQLQIESHNPYLSSVKFWLGSGGSYRYRGKLGANATQDEVFAELGEPLRTAPEGLAGTQQDRTLFVSRIPGYPSSKILYADKGLEFNFLSGKVSSITRYWHR